VLALLSSRHVQTNECGRSALVGPGLTWLSSCLDGPPALVDVGASAGLTLLCDRYRLDYGEHGVTGPPDSPVSIECRVLAGDPPIAERLPPLASRVGIDRSPLDVADVDDARWLLACVWPDTGRLERTAASIRLAQAHVPVVLRGDANDTLPGVLADLPDGTAAIVLTTWSFAYFSLDQRDEFEELLEVASHRRPIAWLSADRSGVVNAFGEIPTTLDQDTTDVLGAVLFEGGNRSGHLLASIQSHGNWIDWVAPPI